MTSRALIFSLITTMLFIAGCAHKIDSTGINHIEKEAETAFWAGRISMQVQSDPVQAFFAGFELKGQADTGELTLISPLGSILGVMRWTPTEATLDQGGSIQRFATTNELLAQTTGAAVPISALFDWLGGKNTTAPGWTADLSQRVNGRITAQRTEPSPQANLRIVLDR